jgi:predicted O-methyltransferase YrrM
MVKLTTETAEAQDLAPRVVAMYAQFQQFRDNPNPEVITDTAVRSWLQEVEALGRLITSESVAGLGPHTSSVDNLRLAARKAMERLLEIPWLSEGTRSKLQEYLERNPVYRQVGPYRFSSDWVSKCESDWRDLLTPLMGVRNVQALEVGSFEGRSAIWLLENVLTDPTSRLVCVDLFDGSYAQVFDENIAASGAASRVERLAGPSGLVLRRLPPEPAFDFIYIDGSHQPLAVLEDAVLSWRLLRPGGLMAFDDYEMAARRLADFSGIARPDIGIDAFLSAAADQLEVVLKGFQVIVRKKAGGLP